MVSGSLFPTPIQSTPRKIPSKITPHLPDPALRLVALALPYHSASEVKKGLASSKQTWLAGTPINGHLNGKLYE